MISANSANTTRYAIIGDGQMGLVCAMALHSKEIPSCIWGRDPEHVADLEQLRESSRHLPGFKLPDSVEITSDDSRAFQNATVIVCAVPTQYIRAVFSRLRPHVPDQVPIVSVAKGIENETLLRPTHIVSDVLNDNPDKAARPLGCLSGPTIADELARCLPATIIAASDDAEFPAQLQRDFTSSCLRVYTKPDLRARPKTSSPSPRASWMACRRGSTPRARCSLGASLKSRDSAWPWAR